MIQIGRHIEILLLSNDCVIVPGLGGFVTHKVNARYDDEDCIFLPPIRTLGFNPQLQLNDSLLVVSYVEAFDISYPEALRMIEAEVEELKQTLSTEGSYEMNGIGCLYLNKEGNMMFEPCEAGVLTPELYALSSFDFARLPMATAAVTVSEPAAAAEPARTTKPAQLAKPVQLAKPAQPPIQTAEEKPVAESATAVAESEEDESNYIHISTTWLKAAVVAAAVLLVAIILTSPNDTVKGCYSHMSTWSTDFIQKLMPKDTNTETLKIQPKAMPVKATIKDSAKAEPATPEPVNTEPAAMEQAEARKDCYTIVLASSTTEENANKYIQTLKAKGYNDAAIHNNGRMTRVVYGCFASEQLAQDSLRKLRHSEYFAEAWVLKI